MTDKMTGDQYLKFAAEAIAKGHAGPADRHLQRAWDAWPHPLTDDQIDRWAEMAERLDKLEGSRASDSVDREG